MGDGEEDEDAGGVCMDPVVYWTSAKDGLGMEELLSSVEGCLLEGNESGEFEEVDEDEDGSFDHDDSDDDLEEEDEEEMISRSDEDDAIEGDGETKSHNLVER
jgi:hypothetical protein